MTLQNAINRIFDRCNLEGEYVDILKIMYNYKAIRELDEEEQDEIYEEIAFRLGFCK